MQKVYKDNNTEKIVYDISGLKSIEQINIEFQGSFEDITEEYFYVSTENLIFQAANKYRQIRNKSYEDGVEYNNILYSLTEKVKQDYLGLTVMKDFLTYPYIVWGENGKNIFNNSTELIAFISFVFNWIQSIEITCQENIEVLPTKTREELMEIIGG